MASRKLPPKRQRFVEEYLKDLNATKAALRAGYSEKTAQEQGSQLLSNLMVQAAIQEGQKAVSERNGLTQDAVLDKLRELRDGAQAAEQFSAAIKAEELRGKQIGMFVDRKELSGPGGGSIDITAMSREDRLIRLNELLAKRQQQSG